MRINRRTHRRVSLTRLCVVALVAGVLAVTAPLLRLEHALHGFSAFVVMPLFAFSNAGVSLGGSAVGSVSGVPPQPVGAEQEESAAIVRAEEMCLALDIAPELVGIAAA